MNLKKVLFTFLLSTFILFAFAQTRSVLNFNKDWKFYLGEANNANEINFNDAKWRTLNLPHDWSIEFPFDSCLVN